jgi:hypothetical protein
MEFADFWKLYPRREAKKDAEKAWGKLSEDQKKKAIESIPVHAKCWCNECREKHFIPLPASWLRGERFEDELSVAEPVERQNWKSDAWVQAEGRRRGIQPRPGEDMQGYISRIRAA